MILFRHVDRRFPFLWETADQPPGRWHDGGEGPVHTFADTPLGAWAELLRHEEIHDPAELTGVQRGLWAVELPDPPQAEPALPTEVLAGGRESYPRCRSEARRLKELGHTGFQAPSAALLPAGARGYRVYGGLQPGPPRDGRVFVLLGRRPDLIGWPVIYEGRPPGEVLDRVRHL